LAQSPVAAPSSGSDPVSVEKSKVDSLGGMIAALTSGRLAKDGRMAAGWRQAPELFGNQMG
jgi:hypothetical protein